MSCLVLIIEPASAIALALSEQADKEVSIAVVDLAYSIREIVIKLAFDSLSLLLDKDACTLALKLSHLAEVPRAILVEEGTKLDALASFEHAIIDRPICQGKLACAVEEVIREGPLVLSSS